jgi:NAD(P)-dependent dehydrogenase (short-subunit alcohol dehydrogenase family)
MNWTTDNIPSLKGKTIIVTGGNSGLGLQSVKAYSEKGAKVVLACRNYDKGEAAKGEILKSVPAAQIVVMTLDLADLSSVHAFADRFNKEFDRLDILLNNAGIMMPPYQLTKDGIESQQGTNHFGHFALTGLLLDKLKKTAGSRVVNVSSLAHKQGKMDFNNLLYENGKGYSPLSAYGRSKLENLLFTYGLQEFFTNNKLDIKAVVAHPGVSDTNLFSKIGGQFLQTIFKPLMKLMVQPAEMGALPQLRASVDVEVKGAEYFGPNGFAEMKGYPVQVQPDKHARNSDDIKKLWEVSKKITGVQF